MYTINQIADYIIFRLTSEESAYVNNLKLQKLLYYTQAWYLAFFDGKPLFEGKFQAWIHGPVNRQIYDRFKDKKYLYSAISIEDIQDPDIAEKIDEDTVIHIDNILEAYMRFSGVELEIMTHKELPWLAARNGFSPTQRCEVEIDENTMASYYKSMLK